VNPTWAKGYARKGAALHGQRRYVEAIDTYEAGLRIEDSPAIRKGYEEVKAAKGTSFSLNPFTSLTGLCV
jgi:stress-induced-phosphoprotein 1